MYLAHHRQLITFIGSFMELQNLTSRNDKKKKKSFRLCTPQFPVISGRTTSFIANTGMLDNDTWLHIGYAYSKLIL